MKVMKFGGTSLGSPEAITRCAELVEREIKLGGKKPVVIVSAHSKVTDKLLEAARKAVKGEIDAPLSRPFRAHVPIRKGPRGVAPGYRIVPRWGTSQPLNVARN